MKVKNMLYLKRKSSCYFTNYNRGSLIDKKTNTNCLMKRIFGNFLHTIKLEEEIWSWHIGIDDIG